MSCEGCAAQFGVFRRRRACAECGRGYCGGCLRRAACAPCRVLAARPLCPRAAAALRARDLQCYLQRRGVSTRGCVEKDELVALCVRVSVGGAAGERRRGPAAGAGGAGGPFSALKGFTNNINDFFANTFDLRRSGDDERPAPAARPPAARPPAARPPAARPPAAARARQETYSDDPGGGGGGLVDARVVIAGSAPRPDAPPAAPAAPPASPPASPPARDTLDCLEVEDLADSGWEVLCVPADPLPEDSDVLMAQAERASSIGPASPPSPRPDPAPAPAAAPAAAPDAAAPRAGPAPDAAPPRAGPETDQRAPPAAAAAATPADSTAGTASLHDEPMADYSAAAAAAAAEDPQAAALAALQEPALAALGARGLKVLLARHAVDSRGCLERAELLEACRRVRRAVQAAPAPDRLPLDDCCKVCMEAPLEVVLLECGHMATCARCAARLHECPICRRYVARAVRVFRS